MIEGRRFRPKSRLDQRMRESLASFGKSENAGQRRSARVSGESFEDFEASGEGGVVNGVGDAEVGVPSAEDVAGDDQQVERRIASATNSVAVPQGARGKT